MELISNSTGNWEIYRIIGSETSEAFIVRLPKINFSDTKTKSYIINYQIIKNIGLPTLKTVEEFESKNRIGIKTEDLNYQQDWIYVTYNSLYSDSKKMVNMLSQNFIKIDENKKSPEYEEFRYRNKLKEITNFKEFMKGIITDLSLATERDVLIEFDSYFFGTQRDSDTSSIDYKIVDLDNIYTNTGKTRKELLADNFSEFKRAIKGFVKYFVILENQPTYEQYLDKIF